jgi:3-(3-hydroxy-phenyl)propionate hydroxylase
MPSRSGGGVAMVDHAVVVVGGGPTGLMLAGEMALAGTDVTIVERRATQELDGPRARGLHSRNDRGARHRAAVPLRRESDAVRTFAGSPLDISDFPTRHNYGLALMQSDFERILAGWVNELGVTIMREHPLGDAWSSRRIRARHPSDDPNDS